MAEPRKITIKLRSPGAKPAGAPAPVAPVAPVAPEAVATPAPEAPSAPMPSAAATPESTAEQTKRQTSRIELPPELVQQPMTAEAPTLKIKTISETASEAPDTAQAAKSKTARIALDSVLGGIQSNTPLANTTQKTIKLKRAVPSGAAHQTTSAPIAPVAAPESEEKTIKLKRPAGLTLKKDAPKPAEEEGLEPLEELEPITETAPLAPAPAPVSTGAKVFTAISVAAAAISIIVTLVLCGVLQRQAASPNGEQSTGNTLHSLPFQRIF